MKEQTSIFEIKEDKKEEVAAATAETKKPAKKSQAKKTETKKAEPKKEEVEKFTFPFGFQFGPTPLKSEYLQKALEFVPGQEYTIEQVKEKLSRAVLELQAPDASVHYIKDKNVFVLTNVLKKKGAGELPAALIESVQECFMKAWLDKGTEERISIYKCVLDNKFLLISYPGKKTSVSVENEIQMYYEDDLDWPLFADLHSHHVMGAYWSSTDNANEQIRGIIFGVCSWPSGNKFEWKFRKYDGENYIDLGVDEVVQQ